MGAADEIEQLCLAHASCEIAALQNPGGELPLAVVEDEDLILDRVACDEPVDRDRPRLPDAMCAGPEGPG